MPAAPKTPDRKEGKRERFVRLAEVRTSASLDAIRKLGQLANPDNYEYGADDTDAIAKAITEELDRTIAALRNGKVPTAASFHLS